MQPHISLQNRKQFLTQLFSSRSRIIWFIQDECWFLTCFCVSSFKKKKEGGVAFNLRTLEILSTHFQVLTTFIILLLLITFAYHVALKKRHDKYKWRGLSFLLSSTIKRPKDKPDHKYLTDLGFSHFWMNNFSLGHRASLLD